ncbi:MAG: type II toxin-antitoxin system VapC family toxin [Prochlorothrix sp.]|nr:type II toxin-antitoxin system VapC family toxin [Prochlorothrix sp.]
MKIVLDANITLALVLSLPATPQAVQKVSDWQKQGYQFFVPTLWCYEVISALRKARVAGFLDAVAVKEAFDQLLGLPIEWVDPTPILMERSLYWAEILGQRVAYDGAYLAVAEAIEAEFWTLDHRLIRAILPLNLGWIHALTAED